MLVLIEGSSLFLAWYRRLRRHVEPIQFMAGFVFAIAGLARLTVLFGAPFFLFVGAGSIWRRGFSAALGAAAARGAAAHLQRRLLGPSLQPGL